MFPPGSHPRSHPGVPVRPYPCDRLRGQRRQTWPEQQIPHPPGQGRTGPTSPARTFRTERSRFGGISGESVPRDRGRAPAPATTPSVRVNPSHLTRAYRCARQRTNRLERGGNRSDARRRACALVARLKDPGRTRPAGHDTRRAADAELTVASDMRFGVYLCPARDAATGALAAHHTGPREGRTASKACSPRAPPLRGQSERAISIRRRARVSF